MIRQTLLRNLILAGLLALCASGTQAQASCPASSAKDVPLSGLWQLNSYREIHGSNNFAHPGDYLLVSPTGIPGEACVEFTQAVEGSYVYYLAMDANGEIIDDTVFTPGGRELRVLIERRNEGISVVLYARASAEQGKGGTAGDGGGVAGGGRP